MKRKPSSSSDDRKQDSYKSYREGKESNDRGDRPFNKGRNTDRPERGADKPGGEDKPKRAAYGAAGRPKPSFEKRGERNEGQSGERRTFDKSSGQKRSFDKPGRFSRDEDKSQGGERSRPSGKPSRFQRSTEDSDRPKRTFDKGDKKPFARREDRDSNNESDRPKRSFDKGDKKPFARREDRDSNENARPKRTFDKGDKKPFAKREDRDSTNENARPKRSFDKGDKKPFARKDDSAPAKRPYEKRKQEGDDRSERPARKIFTEKGHARPFERKVPRVNNEDENRVMNEDELNEKPKTAFNTPHKFKRPADKQANKEDYVEKDESKLGKPLRRRKRVDEDEEEEEQEVESGLMTLNKYIAHSGECSRRDASELVKQGKVKVNGELVTDPGYRVQEDDKVTLVGKKLTPQKNRAYILLNKPKGFITTTEDPQERKTVMDLVANSGVDRLYPVGRLDRNTTGLLLLTNDGDLAQKLSHPAYEVKKIYQVTLNKALTKADFDQIVEGLTLEDGKVRVDELSFLESKKELGIQIHSGRNRIVRRIFESLGYEVEKLDRVIYAGLTKKNLPRSKWRFLTEQEIVLLKHFKS